MEKILNYKIYNYPINYVKLVKRFTSTNSLKTTATAVITQMQKNNSVPVNHVFKYHPMTAMYNRNTLAHIEMFNADQYSYEAIQWAHCLYKTNKRLYNYKFTNTLYVYEKYNFPLMSNKPFEKFVEMNSCTYFHGLAEKYNIHATPFIKNTTLAHIQENPKQLEPDLLLNFTQAQFPIEERGIHGYDLKAGSAILKPESSKHRVNSLVLTSATPQEYSDALEILILQYKELPGGISTQQREFFKEFEQYYNDIEKQTICLANNIHLLPPSLLPPLRSTENFNTKLLKDENKKLLPVEEKKSIRVSDRLYAENIPQPYNAKQAKAIFDANANLWEDIFNTI